MWCGREHRLLHLVSVDMHTAGWIMLQGVFNVIALLLSAVVARRLRRSFGLGVFREIRPRTRLWLAFGGSGRGLGLGTPSVPTDLRSAIHQLRFRFAVVVMSFFLQLLGNLWLGLKAAEAPDPFSLSTVPVVTGMRGGPAHNLRLPDREHDAADRGLAPEDHSVVTRRPVALASRARRWSAVTNALDCKMVAAATCRISSERAPRMAVCRALMNSARA